MSDECIFCQIVAGEAPAYTVYEDEETLAFLDVNPVSNGHTLVIPKVHAAEITDLDLAINQAVFRTVQRVVQHVRAEFDVQGVNILQNNGEGAGQEVHHMHVHVIPRYEDDGFDFTFAGDELPEAEAEQLVDTLGGSLG